MRVSLNRQWMRDAYPNAPTEILDELLGMLRAFYPNAETTFDAPNIGMTNKHWSFPFLIESHEVDTFNYEEFEEWQVLVEYEIAEKYNLNMEVFCC